MAPVAKGSKASTMYIVILVTAGAGFGHADLTFHRFSVAGEALQPFMGPI